MNVDVERNRRGRECDGCCQRVRGRFVFVKDGDAYCAECFGDVLWEAESSREPDAADEDES